MIKKIIIEYQKTNHSWQKKQVILAYSYMSSFVIIKKWEYIYNFKNIGKKIKWLKNLKMITDIKK